MDWREPAQEGPSVFIVTKRESDGVGQLYEAVPRCLFGSEDSWTLPAPLPFQKSAHRLCIIFIFIFFNLFLFFLFF